jgi:hypothetical protein
MQVPMLQSAGLECVMIATRNGFRDSDDFQEIDAVLTLFFFCVCVCVHHQTPTLVFIWCASPSVEVFDWNFTTRWPSPWALIQSFPYFPSIRPNRFLLASLLHYNAGHRQPLRLSSGKCVVVAALTQLSPRRITKFITLCRDSTVDNSSCFCRDWG